MNPILAGVALAVVAGTVVAISGRDARITVLGLTVALVLSPLLADPAATPLGLAARLTGAILAGYLLGIVARDRPEAGRSVANTGGSRIGWPAEVLIAGGALIVGFGTHGLGAPAGGSALGSATGFAVAALALAPILTGRDILRVGIGSLLLVDGGLIVRSALGGTPGDFEQLIAAGTLVVLAGVLAALASRARSDGRDGFAMDADEPLPGRGFGTRSRRRRREPDAHPIESR